MSTHTATTYYCDVPACDATYTAEDLSEVVLAEREAERNGWLLAGDGKDYCPDCALTVEPA